MVKTKLELTFLDELGKSMKVSIDDPKEDLDEIEIQDAMEDIISYNIFQSNEGDIVIASGAKIITTTVREMEF